MIKALLIILFSTSMNYSYADINISNACKDLSAVAKIVMLLRQQDEPKSNLIKMTMDAKIVSIITRAYQTPKFDTGFMRDLVAKDFEKDIFSECYDKLNNVEVQAETGDEANNINASCNVDLTDTPKYSGIYSCNYSNGNKAEEGCHIDGKRYAWWTEWYTNGNEKYSAFYKMGGDISRSSEYNENGELIFDNNHTSSGLTIPKDDEESGLISRHMDKYACYCGSDSERVDFLKKNKLFSCADLDRKSEKS